MKQLITFFIYAAIVATVSAPVFADSTSTSTSTANPVSVATGGDQQQGIGFSQDFSNHSRTAVAASDLSNAVGAAVAPALTTTLTETCMGSTSVGAGFSGGSFSFGTTWRDSACVRRLDARQIQSMGDVQAAKEIMCDSDLVRAAFKRVGRPCAEDGGAYTPVVKAEAPVVAPATTPATTQKVEDEQDLADAQNKAILDKADAARQAIKDKYNF